MTFKVSTEMKTLKNGKKNGTGNDFQRKKGCFVLSVENTKKN